jgi:AcrR family transcriptional regulator
VLVAGDQASYLYRPAGTVYVMATDTRDRILASVGTLLSRGGPSAVTLEAVAEHAGVSKGGLLYHFPSKAALYTGLLEASRDRVKAEMAERMETMSAAEAFLDYSTPTETEDGFGVALITAVHNERDVEPVAHQLMVDGFVEWERPMVDAVADPVLAEIIRLVGNGIYLTAISGLPQPDPELLAKVVQRLLGEADG